MKIILFAAFATTLPLLATISAASTPDGLYFREDFRASPPAIPITQEHLANPRLKLKLYGPSGLSVKKSHHEEKQDDPFYAWSGECQGNWALAFQKEGRPANLAGSQARLRVATFNSDRTLYFLFKTPAGWVVSDQGAGPSPHWTITTFRVSDLRWHALDIGTVARRGAVDSPALNAIEEIGVTDLQAGQSSAHSSRLDWIEVWENPPANRLYAVPGEEGYHVYEGDSPVLFYRTKTKTLNAKWGRADYVHPLWGLHNEILTEDFPTDHPHHRGIFWSWHQLLIQGRRIGDAWACQNFIWDVRDVHVQEQPQSVSLRAEVLWKSPQWHEGADPIVRETTEIQIHARERNQRAIDFAITLQALLPDVELGGSDDEKGYGGFTARLPSPAGMRYVGKSGPLQPRLTSVPGGPWVNFAGELNQQPYAVEIMQHPANPQFPQPWILRDEPHPTNMQNPAWPGRAPVPLSMAKPVVLRYRLLIHDHADPASAYQKYSGEK